MQVNTNYTLDKQLRVERLIASYFRTANYIKKPERIPNLRTG